ncbi:hypothetical protein [Cupriavidus taiwanensis]|uniref:hypothetical protein n=1 Tax=Cupriavidus taiwanensis TaxID=164546 RepID=UPI000E17E0FD|nr:hypothetical protein [Cupriavidus taiwanensis]SPA17259.1 conserved hypothetical protein [Cupriavidus taiwanensis]
MASAGSLIFEIAADVSRLNAGLAQAQKSVDDAAKSINTKLSANLAMNVGQLAADAIRVMVDAVKEAIDQADQMGKLAQATGMTTEEFSTLAAVAEYAGLSVNDLSGAMKTLEKNMADSQKEGSNAAKAFADLGISTKDMMQQDPTEVLMKVADAFAKSKDGAAKSVIAQQLFKGEWEKMIPFLNQGREGIAEASEELKKMGIVINDETAQAAGNFNDRLTDLKNVQRGVARSMMADLLPGLTQLAESFVDSAKSGGILDAAMWVVNNSLKVVMSAIIALNEWVALTGRNFKVMAQAFMQAIHGDFAGAWATLQKGGEDVSKTVSTIGERVKKVWVAPDAPVPQATKVQTELNTTLGTHTPKAAKAAKQAVDEYAKAMESLNEKIRVAQAGSDPIALLTTSQMYLKLTKEQQAAILAKTLEEQSAQKTAEQAKKDEAELVAGIEASNKAREDAKKAIADQATAMEAAADPYGVYLQDMAKIEAINNSVTLSTEARTKAETAAWKKYLQNSGQAVDPMMKQMEELKQAFEGFGKQSADMFVDFISGADKASSSFSELVANMLRDMAKMLLYQNVMKGLFAGVSQGVGGWLQNFGIGGARMAGGRVYPGVGYTVGESPFRRETFVPAVPGTIVPGHKGGDMGAGITLNVTINRDGSDKTSEDKGEQQDESLIQTARKMASAVRRVIIEEKRPGGLLAS